MRDPRPSNTQDQQRKMAQSVGVIKRRIIKTVRHEARKMDEEIVARLDEMEAKLNRLIDILALYLENVELKGILRKLSEEQK